ncbi:hypothetical protein M0R45_025418 [Rubus argutus]|uniref:Uncharacterized protein n=1 Tax=Rubus argutus TaxID=59490 RepID=A0AAW1WX68_RUBAR
MVQDAVLIGKKPWHEIVEEEEMGGQHCPHVSLPTRAYHELQLLNSWLAAGDASESSFSNSLEAAACVHNKILSKTQRKRLRKKVGTARSKKRVKKSRSGGSPDELTDDPDEVEDDSIGNLKKRKAERVILPRVSNTTASFNSGTSTIPEMLKEILKLQQRTEIEWIEMMERRAQELQLFEQGWRQKMVKVEREEQRRMREESRAERRNALITTILNKLIDQTNF